MAGAISRLAQGCLQSCHPARTALDAPRRCQSFSVSSAVAPQSDVFRIVSPTAILGYGYPSTSLDAALSGPVGLIAADAGSIDPGPYYLATRTSFTSRSQVKRDLRLMIQAAVQKSCPLVVGSAGGCGSNNQVQVLEEDVQDILQDLGIDNLRVASVTSELSLDLIRRLRPRLRALGKMPEISEAALERSVFVAQMGVEPIMTALDHAEVILCGRAYDPAVFAAEALRRGFPVAAALHAAKILECGAIAAVPGSGSDCLVADLHADGRARVFASNPMRQATSLSVAAHTLYEKSHPHCFAVPGGILSTSHGRFVQQDGAVEISGQQFCRTQPSVKIEGAAVRGHRAVALALVNGSVGFTSSGFIYGVNGVSNQALTSDEEELGIVISVSGGLLEQRKTYLALLRSSVLHFGFEGRKATAGNVAFPFSPSDLLLDEGQEVLTIFGTRDPAFIAQWPYIIEQVKTATSVALPIEAAACKVHVAAGGLTGMPRLAVAEAVGDDLVDARKQLPAVPSDALQVWTCDGGCAADYTLQHLLNLDQEVAEEIFSIRVRGPCGEQSIPMNMNRWRDTTVAPNEQRRNALEVYERCVRVSAATAESAASSIKAGRVVGEAARVVRSKNSGVNEITFDIIFDEDVWPFALQSPAWTPENMQELLNLQVLGVFFDNASCAVKITCEREVLAGSVGDRDVYGAQQHTPLLKMRF